MSRANLIRLGLLGVLVVALLLFLRMRGAAAQDMLGDAAAGHRLAAAWCSECHAPVPGSAQEGPART